MLEVLQVLMWGNEARVLDLHRANVTTDTLKGLKWSRKVCENQAGGCEGLVGLAPVWRRVWRTLCIVALCDTP